MKICLVAKGALLVLACLALAQSPASNEALPVELSVPFGVVPGRLLLLGNHLVFLDEQQLKDSFVIPKAAIENLNAEGTTVAVRTTEPIRLRSGDVRSLSFRVSSGGDAGVVPRWYGAGPSSGATMAAAPVGATIHQARHDHTFGNCHGRLIVSPEQLSYESVTEVDHSRRWEYRGIREISLPNPYELEVKPASGGTYKLFLEGSGMDPAVFRSIVDRVTAGRSGP
jgi:hypothetical protein